MPPTGEEPTPNTPPPTAPTPPPARKGIGIPNGWWLLVLLTAVVLVFLLSSNSPKYLTYTEFDNILAEGHVKSVTFVDKTRLHGEVRDRNAEKVKELKLNSNEFAINLPVVQDQTAFIERIQAKDKAFRDKLKKDKPDEELPKEIQIRVNDETPQFIGPMLWTMILLGCFVAFFIFYIIPRIRDPQGGGFLSSYTRSPAKRYERGRTRIAFDDVAGMEGAKRELSEVVDFLKSPEKFTRLGAQVPKGVLLVGPPGTGKTLLAKAVAGEANVPFYSINGSEFIQMFVGVGASRVRDLFKTAKETAPCVIFIDEIDAVGRMRGAGVGGGSDEREQTLNQILSEMDGFQPNETVIVLAATNRPDVLDAALLRPGRFDRHVTVDRPNWQGRLAILKVHTRNKPLDDKLDLERIARSMIGMSGADLRNLCNEAALVATRLGKNKLEQIDFDTASDRVRLGLKREEQYSDVEKKRTAYHEAGHALCAWLQPLADPIDRVSIIPRGRSGGVTMFTPDEDRQGYSFSQFMARLVMTLGGRAADKLITGEACTGEAQDIKDATRLARAMVTQFGMSERLGPVHYKHGEEHVFLGKDIAENRDFSEGTARIIDEEVQRIVTNAETEAMRLLTVHRDELELLTQALLANEELDREAVESLLRKGHMPERAVAPSPAAVATPESVVPEPGTPPKLAFGGA